MIKKISCIILLMAVISGCGPKTEEDLVRTTYALGTVISINLYDQGDEGLMTTLIQRIDEIEQLMSSQIDDSEVNQIAHDAGIRPTKVSDETFKVIKKSLYFAELSKGSFDPTIEPIVKLWGIGTEEAQVPSKKDISSALALVDYTKIQLDEGNKTVYLSMPGMSLDLGGIAKGYVADELVKLLDKHKVQRAMISLGGNIYAYGEKSNGDPFNVAIQTPYDTRNTYFGYLGVKNGTVVTSGPYERFIEVDGKVYHHIFDAKTGYPVEGNLVSVTVVGKNSMNADALSTVLFTMPASEGLRLIEGMEGR